MTAKKSNPKGGRPKKEIKKDHAYTVRVTADEAKQIEDEASRLNLTVSEYFLQCSKNTKLIEPDPNRIYLLSELGKIGSNINQISKELNSREELTPERKNALNAIFNNVKALVDKYT
jgi:hypothetical protein